MPLSEVQPKSGPLPDTSGIEELRGLYRPERVRLLLVGESSPAGGTHFDLANSNLFQATREAFVLALDETGIPSGGGFLEFFRDAGGWLVDLADRPVNHLSNSERRRIVNAGVPRLTRTIDATGPD